ncbi:MAG: zf-HC2 domain-containing protein [Actinomycetota bacterium]|nr:zf-HC2 domain-containing protein [Actinomycetota bacterium]
MILGLSGHLGDRVSALVDGQLSGDDEERAWAHAMTCPGCRRLVEREGWLKTRLSTMSDPTGYPGTQPGPGLIGALYDVDAWSTVDAIERRGRARRTAMVAAGAGSVGAAVIGLLALTGAPAGMGEAPPTRQAPASVSTNAAGQGASLGPAVGLLRRHAR